METLQKENSFVVELTPEGLQEIQQHKNIYTEDTKPIPLAEREWSTKKLYHFMDWYSCFHPSLYDGKCFALCRFDLVSGSFYLRIGAYTCFNSVHFAEQIWLSLWSKFSCSV